MNVLAHVMVPDHKIMDDGAVRDLLASYKITHEQLDRKSVV